MRIFFLILRKLKKKAMKKFAFVLSVLICTSCSQSFDYKVADPGQDGHLENFVISSKQATSEIQSDSLNLEKTIALQVALEEYRKKYPKRYQKLQSETNGWQIAKNLKSDKDFVRLAKRSGLNLKQVPYIGRD